MTNNDITAILQKLQAKQERKEAKRKADLLKRFHAQNAPLTGLRAEILSGLEGTGNALSHAWEAFYNPHVDEGLSLLAAFEAYGDQTAVMQAIRGR